MSGKVKMRCARCGKTFKPANPRLILCDQCDARARTERTVAKAAPQKPASSAPVETRAPKVVGPGAAILVPGLALPHETSQPPDVFSGRREHESRHGRSDASHGAHSDGHRPAVRDTARNGAPAGVPAHGERHHDHEKATPAPQPGVDGKMHEARQKRAVVSPFVLTEEMRDRIEKRYTELAQPTEFDGIRTQIARELNIPKALVKRAILELRQRTHTLSWWEVQAFTGATSDLERVRAAYVPLLPIPPVGVHKLLAQQLHLSPEVVYLGIKRIRADMHLPQFNPPELHAVELAESPSAIESVPQSR